MKSRRPTLWGIAMPLMLNMLISQIQLVIDRSFLGQLNIEYMSALGNVAAPLWTTIAVAWALNTGATVLMSQAIGAGKNRVAAEYAHSAFKFNNVFAVLIFFLWFFLAEPIFRMMGVREPILTHSLQYVRFLFPMILVMGIYTSSSGALQAIGYTRPILISGIVRSGLNIILDWALIFGHLGLPEMGLRGAALATSIAEIIGATVIFILVLRTDRLPYRLSIKGMLGAPLRNFLPIVRKGLPSAGEELLWNSGNLAIIRLLNTISILAAGIYTIIFSVDILPAMIFIALGQGVLTLTGQKTGEGDGKGAVKVGLRGLRDSWIIATVVFLAFLIFPRTILGLFTSDTQIIEGSIRLLVVAGINFYPRSVNIVLGHAIRGYGDTAWMMKTQIFGTIFVVSMAALMLFVFELGILGIFIAIVCDETARGIINTLRFLKGPTIIQALPQRDEDLDENEVREKEVLRA